MTTFYLKLEGKGLKVNDVDGAVLHPPSSEKFPPLKRLPVKKGGWVLNNEKENNLLGS